LDVHDASSGLPWQLSIASFGAHDVPLAVQTYPSGHVRSPHWIESDDTHDTDSAATSSTPNIHLICRR
jgi:hypothetical protein